MECLKALWALGEGNVRQVREVLLRQRPLAYTTVMTVLDRLARRKCVQRRKVGRSFRYSPLLSRDSVRRLAIKDLVDCFFDGDEEAFRIYMTGAGSNSNAAPTASDASLDASLL
jgi:predicted transcriptional regulator